MQYMKCITYQKDRIRELTNDVSMQEMKLQAYLFSSVAIVAEVLEGLLEEMVRQRDCRQLVRLERWVHEVEVSCKGRDTPTFGVSLFVLPQKISQKSSMMGKQISHIRGKNPNFSIKNQLTFLCTKAFYVLNQLRQTMRLT